MKAADRQALQQNELQEYTGHLKPFLERYGRLIALVAALLVLAFVAYSVYRGAARSGMEAGWGDLFAARDVAGFEAAAEFNADTGAAVWAHLSAADSYLRTGAGGAFTDRTASEDDFAQAREHFETALAIDDAPDAARAKALYGLGNVAEATGGGETDEAIGTYKRLLEEYPNSPFAAAAEVRLKALKRADAGPFLAWFVEQDPSPADLARPVDAGPAGVGDDAPIPGVDPPAESAPGEPAPADPPPVPADPPADGE